MHQFEQTCGGCGHATHWRECQRVVVGLLGSSYRCECRRRGPSYTKCANCDKLEDDEIHLTQRDLDYQKDMYNLYKGEEQAGLINNNYESLGDVDFIRDEMRNK